MCKTTTNAEKRVSPKNSFNLHLNGDKEGADTTSSGKEFQLSTTLIKKEKAHISFMARFKCLFTVTPVMIIS